MSLLELSFASGEGSLSVRRVQVHEGVSILFNVSVWARSPSPDMDLTALVGQPAALSATAGERGTRAWSGVVAFIEQVQGEAGPPGEKPSRPTTSASCPRLWLLTQRRNHRIFQHLSIPDIVDKLLGEWGIAPDVADRPRHATPSSSTRCSTARATTPSSPASGGGGHRLHVPGRRGDGTTLMLDDALQPGRAPRRAHSPTSTTPARPPSDEFVTDVRLAHEVRPGRAHPPRLRLPQPGLRPLRRGAEGRRARRTSTSSTTTGPARSSSRAAPAATRRSPTTRASARHDQTYGTDRAQRALDGERAGKRAGRLRDQRHRPLAGRRLLRRRTTRTPSSASGEQLLVIELTTARARSASEWTHRRQRRLRRRRRTARRAARPSPRSHGVQSATVVGPAGQEIHTDEFGRVRVQFPWDREGTDRRRQLVLDAREPGLGGHRLRHDHHPPRRAGGAGRLPRRRPRPARRRRARLQRRRSGALQAAGPQDAQHVEERQLARRRTASTRSCSRT